MRLFFYPKGGDYIDSNIIKARIAEYGLKLIEMPSGYSKYNDKIYCEDDDGYKYFVSYKSIKSNHKPYAFISSNPFVIYNIKLWINNNNKKFELVSNTYVNAQEKLKWKCLVCGNEFYATWGHIKSGRGCRYCQYINNAHYFMTPKKYEDSFEYNYPELAKEWDYEKNEKLPSQYKPGSDQKVWWICPICKYSYNTSISHRTKHESGCPKCNMSHGEKRIYNHLIKNKIRFTPQYKFPDCKNQRCLPFDFYLHDYNVCIEFQGEQHYSPYDFQQKAFHTEKAVATYEKIKKNDLIKKQYCKDNQISFLEIRYDQIDQIPEIIENFLGGLPKLKIAS